jgi:hypothetical protein
VTEVASERRHPPLMNDDLRVGPAEAKVAVVGHGVPNAGPVYHWRGVNVNVQGDSNGIFSQVM